MNTPPVIMRIDLVSQECLQQVRKFLKLAASIRLADTSLQGSAPALGP